MLRKQISIVLILAIHGLRTLVAQDSLKYTLMLRLPVFDYPENIQSNYSFPSMQQALNWSSSLYDLSFWGIHEASESIIKNRNNKKAGRIAEKGLEYVFGLAFSKYGSELPIPLGIWGHEAYHISVLGNEGYSPLNGNSLFHRWDGTVYGLTDEELSQLKQDNLSQLLYSYVAGVQYEIQSTKTNVINDFYHQRLFYKAPLYLYNAWYVYDYFHFATSAASDSAKILAPPHEDADPFLRDFAGADLTAWNYDMFSPEERFENRDEFPNGEGLNRRIGFSDLTRKGQDYLNRQKKLALINFLNPAILFINRIKVSDNFSFLPFAQYIPTHFGNCISVNIPFTLNQTNHFLALNNYNNLSKSFWGLEYGIFNLQPLKNKRIHAGTWAGIWQQPMDQSYYDEKAKTGASLGFNLDYSLSRQLSVYAKVNYKTEGWAMGNPELGSVFNFTMGLSFQTFNR